MIFELSKQHSIAGIFLAELRNIDAQKDSMRFRRNLERMGEILAYEISKTLEWETLETETPLGIAQVIQLKKQPVLATILRAGLPLHQGLLNYFDKAENAFIATYRKHERNDSNTFSINMEYFTSPPLHDADLIIADPMLATGQSMVETLKKIQSIGKPKHIHIVSVIASKEGIEYIKKNIPNVSFWIAAIDEELTAKAYIVPGLGDAGDLAYGKKIQD